jgi:hypothetical protein
MDKQVAFFEQEIPLCSSESVLRATAELTAESGLRLETREQLLQGDEAGPDVVSHNGGQSCLWQAVNDNGLEMNPQQKLTESEIEARQ